MFPLEVVYALFRVSKPLGPHRTFARSSDLPAVFGPPLGLRTFLSLVLELVALEPVAMASIAGPIAQEIDSLLASASSGKAPLVNVVEKVLTMLQQAGLSYKATLPVRSVGVDPSNRDGFGLSAENVHALGDDIAFMGWSWGEVKHPTCVEEAPGGTLVNDFTRALCDGSPLLPDVKKGSLKYGSLSCSHTHMFLRCIEASVKSENAALSLDGKLSFVMVEAKDKEFAKAVRRGLTWTVLSHEVRTRFPTFLTLVQSARNVSQQVGRVEHEVQMMLRIHRLASVQQRQGLEPQWEAIKAAVLRSRPPCAPDLPQLIAFVASCAGGVDAPFLHGLVEFHRLCVNPDARKICGGFFQSVADNLASAPYIALAMVKAQYTCPKDKVNRHKECAWISEKEVSTLSKQQRLDDAEQELRSTHLRVSDSAKQEGVPLPVVVEVLANLDTKLIRFLLEKEARSSTSASATSVKELCQQAVRSLVAKAPETLKHVEDYLETPTLRPEVSTPPSGSAQKLQLRLAEFKDGQAEAIVKLRAKGFDVDVCVVELKKPSGQFKIDKTTQDDVILVPSDSSDKLAGPRILPVEEFLQQFRLAPAKQVVRVHPGWPSGSPMRTDAYQLHIAKAMISIAMQRASLVVGELSEHVEIYDKPRSVRAKMAFAPRVLRLVPESFKVSARFEGDAHVPGDVGASFVSGSPLSTELAEKTSFWITPAFSDSFVSVFGALGHTSNPAAANMTWDSCTVHDVMVVSLPGQSASAALPAASPSGHEFTVKLHIMVNKCKLAPGDELLTFRQESKRKEAPILVSKVVGKRAKIY